MKTFFAIVAGLAYFINFVAELGASASWWEPIPQPHWWLAGCFFCLALDCIADIFAPRRALVE